VMHVSCCSYFCGSKGVMMRGVIGGVIYYAYAHACNCIDD
jgi:hypothetical protein